MWRSACTMWSTRGLLLHLYVYLLNYLHSQAVSKVEKQMGSAQSGPIISLLDACPPSGFWAKLHRISKDAAAGAERSLKQVGGQSPALYGLGAEELGQGAEYWPRVSWTSLALQQLLHRACCNAQPFLLEEVNTDRPPEVAPDTACNHPFILAAAGGV
jgi:hypothetical protein